MGKRLTDNQRAHRAADAAYKRALAMSTWADPTEGERKVADLATERDRLAQLVEQERRLAEAATAVDDATTKPAAPATSEDPPTSSKGKRAARAGAKAAGGTAKAGKRVADAAEGSRIGRAVRDATVDHPIDETAKGIRGVGEIVWSAAAGAIGLAIVYQLVSKPDRTSHQINNAADWFHDFVFPDTKTKGDGTVRGGERGGRPVDARDLNRGAVGTKELNKGAVGTKDLNQGAIGTGDLNAGAMTAQDLYNN